MEEYDYTPILTGLLIGLSGQYLVAREIYHLKKAEFKCGKFLRILFGRNYPVRKNVSFRAWPTDLFIAFMGLVIFMIICFGDYVNNTPILSSTINLIFHCALFLFIFLGFMPARIAADNTYLYIIGVGYTRKVEISKIDTICEVDNSDHPRCKLGSFGLFGYWGYWEDDVHGRFWAHFGRHDQRFFVRLKDGRSFMLGCKDHSTVVDFLQSRHAEFEKEAELRAWASQFQCLRNTDGLSPREEDKLLKNLFGVSFRKIERTLKKFEKFLQDVT